MFVYRDAYYYVKKDWESSRKDPYPINTTELIVAKQRQGDAGTRVKLFYDKPHQVYHNMAQVD
jgi:replicative DNA helicase